MPVFHVQVLESVQEVLQVRDLWNDLWSRSGTTRPTSRAEFLPGWVDQFAPDEKFRAIVVEEAREFVAVLPLIGKRWCNVLPIGSLPRNEWLSCGNLLVDESRDPGRSLDLLADTLRKMPWSIYRFPLIPSHETGWHLLRESLVATGWLLECRPSFDVSLIEVTTDWETYQRCLSKGHRKKLARTTRQMQEQGGYRLQRFCPHDPATVAPLMERAFEIEDSGWKGKAGTSVLRTPGMREWLTRIGENLASRGELELAFLEFNREFVAFEFLWNAKGVLHSYKVGYNDNYHTLMPGTILMHELLRELFETNRCRAYDCLGPRTLATDKWGGTAYQKAQWTATSRHSIGRAFMFGYHWLGRRSGNIGMHSNELRRPAETAIDSTTSPAQFQFASTE